MKNSENTNFKLVETAQELDACFKIREEVFIHEQRVPREIELDEYDQTAAHFLLFYEEKPVSTARMLKKDDKIAKIGRVAVLKEYRSKKLGRILMENILEHCRNSGITKVLIDAQTYVVPFYEKLGFRQYGEEFMDANIPHYKMELSL